MLYTAGMNESGEKNIRPKKAEQIVHLDQYDSVEKESIPLVVTIEHLIKKFSLNAPAIVEVGPIPTAHFRKTDERGGGLDVYDSADAKRFRRNSDVPPIYFLAERHPDWHLAAVSNFDIPSGNKKTLLGTHHDLLINNLGPERTQGIYSEDAFDKRYMKGEDFVERNYPFLLEKLGGEKPNVIFGRHVFDGRAKGYLVGKLTTVAAMMLRPGGFLVSQIYGSDARYSYIPVGNAYHFPFDMPKNMKHILTISFPNRNSERDYVYVYQKTGDSIRPVYLDR